MKKMCTLSLIVCLMLACLGARAESIPVTLDDVVAFSRPDTLALVELTEEDEADGLCYAASSDELELYVYKLTMDGVTPEDFIDTYASDASLEDVTHRTEGGMDIVTYHLGDEEAGAIVPTDQDIYYEFFFYYVTDDAKTAMEAILGSIMPA